MSDETTPPRRGPRHVDWTAPEEETPGEAREARRRAGREVADESSTLSERLMTLNAEAFDQIPVAGELADELRRARAMRNDSGQRRTIRYIASLLRIEDRTPILAALARIDAGKAVANTRQHHWEAWRDRLMREGDVALDALLIEHPNADRQSARNLVRQARKEADDGRPPRARRELFRLLRNLDTDLA